MTSENASEQPEYSNDDIMGVIEIEKYPTPPSDTLAQSDEVSAVETNDTVDTSTGTIELETYDVSDEVDTKAVDIPQATYVPEVIATEAQVATTQNVTQATVSKSTKVNSMSTNTPTPKQPSSDNFEDFVLMPESSWPPPIYMKKNISPKERFYLEYRWHSQWSYYDSKATQNKEQYYRLQWIVVIGSLVIPALVSVASTLSRFLTNTFNGGDAESEAMWRIGIDAITIVISLFVAGAASLETLYKYGENWNGYRSAAEELQAEKNFYDMSAGPYANSPAPFATFVERIEGIVANQNGKYFQAVQQQLQKQSQENEDIVASFKAGDDDDEAQISISRYTSEPTETDAIPEEPEI